MKKLLLIFVAIGMMAGFGNRVMAQANIDSHTLNLNIAEVALLDIYGASGTTITLAPTTTVAGAKIAASNNTDLYLNVSSIVDATETKIISVKTSAVVAGFDLKVVALKVAGGEGTFGTEQSVVTLTTSDQSLVTGIGSCWTDVDAKGYNLTYSLVTNTYASLRSGTNPLTITYTISATD